MNSFLRNAKGAPLGMWAALGVSVTGLSAADLTSLQPSTPLPAGTTIEWHTAQNVTGSSTLVPNPSMVGPGVYYAVYHFSSPTENCYSAGSPAVVAANACGISTVDLTASVNAASAPAGMEVTYHTASPPADGNRIANPASVPVGGKYYTAFRDTVNGCYSTANPILTELNRTCDTDGDGVPDVTDLDDDNDGIPDSVEQATAGNNGDTDGDGIPDHLDLDADNDGILDLVESGSGTPDANGDGRVDGSVGANGLLDSLETAPESGIARYIPRDTDGDGNPDFQDLDSDNDGLNDVTEASSPGVDNDTDGDGMADGPVSPVGVPGMPANPTTGLTPPDTDGDGRPDYRDLDSDNDGINDVTESGQPDPDNNGIAGNGPVPPDTDGDGIPDAVDGTPDFGDANDSDPRNSDDDSIPDYRDLDSDNDTVSDIIEGGNGGSDPDGNGTIDSGESPDGDGDGIPDVVDDDPGNFGDAGNTPPANTDGTDTPDYTDPDKDNDGTPDITESGNGPLDPDGDGQVDNPVDPDGDGVPDNGGNDRDPDEFGGTTNPDPDGDGIPNGDDLDDDNDGILDTVELATAGNNGDTDGDGIPDTLDLDSDNDGILDLVESGSGTPDADGDGRVDGPAGPNGYLDTLETTPEGGVPAYTVRDTDGDGHPDFQDLDSDNDGLNDVTEASPPGADNDLDGDGQADGPVDPNGIPSMSAHPGPGLTPPDTDGDNTPDYRDLDSDNDGINDVTEAGLPDPDNNGIVGTGPAPTDTDGDGIPNVADGKTGFGDANDPNPRNSDNDGIPDYRDLDSDNDTVGDIIEGGNGGKDPDGNGTIDPGESPDGDGDGIPDVLDDDPSNFGDSGNTPPVNTDGTDTPDYTDPDKDNDGTPDITESGNGPLDPDGDGQVDNPADPDGDGVPNNGGNDRDPDDFGGTTPPDLGPDTDGDGIPDSNDLDDDNDGIPDTVEDANAINGGDTDGDGIRDSLDLDSDNDGIPDVVEAGHSGLDTDRNGRIDGAPSVFGSNGLANMVETTPESGVINYTPRDTDGDGREDYVDLDSDNDTISDLLESGNGALVDADHDGVADGTPDSNGLPPGSGLTSPVDTDNDGQPDYRDTNSHNDGTPDIVDNGFSALDGNGDGRVDDISDPEGDGIPNIVDTRDTEFGGFPLAGCAAWAEANPADTDGDVFPAVQEYAFGGNPSRGDHRVSGTTRRQGITVVQNAGGGVNVSIVRPSGRFDVTCTLLGNADLGSTWTELGAPDTVTPNGDGTDTLIWSNAQTKAPLTADIGFVRVKVETPCEPDGSYTLVQGWSGGNIVGKRQTYGVNFPAFPVFTGLVDGVSGSTISSALSSGGANLGSYLIPGTPYYIEFTDGPAEGHRIDVTGGGVSTFSLNLAGASNTTSVLPAGAAGSHYVIRPHRTLGEVFRNTEWDGSSSVGTADQVLFFTGSGYDTYFDFPNDTWVKQGGGFGSQNGKVIPPGEAVFVVHASPADTNRMLQIGEVRYNDFRRPLTLGTTGQNFFALGYPLDNSPAGLGITQTNGFRASSTVGNATQILNWTGDNTANTTGFITNFQLANGVWRTQGNLTADTSNSLLFKVDRGAFIDVQADKKDWVNLMPWDPVPWIQP